jgi:hypothetical protein
MLFPAANLPQLPELGENKGTPAFPLHPSPAFMATPKLLSREPDLEQTAAPGLLADISTDMALLVIFIP